MFMVSARSDSAALFMASVICIGTRLMRRAAKRRSIVTLGFLGLGAHENSTHGAVFSLRKLGRPSTRFLRGDRGSQAGRADHLILAMRPVVGYFWNWSASWPGMTRSGLPPAS